MTSPAIPLTTIKGGLSRLRVKGAALRDSLYDLVNGYVTASKTVKVRPGTVRTAQLNTLTKGLVAFEDQFHVFCHKQVAIPAGYVLHVLAHPAGTDVDNPIPLSIIHAAFPFMGFLYVVAEFDLTGIDTTLGDTFHFWCQTGAVWQADKDYQIGDIVSPSIATGFQFQATRLSAANPVWTPNTVHAEGDIVEPTVPNGFYFTAVDTEGDNPVSGATEPLWPIASGAQVFEDSEVSGSDTSAAVPAPQASTNAPSTTTQNRYDNPYNGPIKPFGVP